MICTGRALGTYACEDSSGGEMQYYHIFSYLSKNQELK